MWRYFKRHSFAPVLVASRYNPPAPLMRLKLHPSGTGHPCRWHRSGAFRVALTAPGVDAPQFARMPLRMPPVVKARQRTSENQKPAFLEGEAGLIGLAWTCLDCFGIAFGGDGDLRKNLGNRWCKPFKEKVLSTIPPRIPPRETGCPRSAFGGYRPPLGSSEELQPSNITRHPVAACRRHAFGARARHFRAALTDRSAPGQTHKLRRDLTHSSSERPPRPLPVLNQARACGVYPPPRIPACMLEKGERSCDPNG